MMPSKILVTLSAVLFSINSAQAQQSLPLANEIPATGAEGSCTDFTFKIGQNTEENQNLLSLITRSEAENASNPLFQRVRSLVSDRRCVDFVIELPEYRGASLLFIYPGHDSAFLVSNSTFFWRYPEHELSAACAHMDQLRVDQRVSDCYGWQQEVSARPSYYQETVFNNGETNFEGLSHKVKGVVSTLALSRLMIPQSITLLNLQSQKDQLDRALPELNRSGNANVIFKSNGLSLDPTTAALWSRSASPAPANADDLKVYRAGLFLAVQNLTFFSSNCGPRRIAETMVDQSMVCHAMGIDYDAELFQTMEERGFRYENDQWERGQRLVWQRVRMALTTGTQSGFGVMNLTYLDETRARLEYLREVCNAASLCHLDTPVVTEITPSSTAIATTRISSMNVETATYVLNDEFSIRIEHHIDAHGDNLNRHFLIQHHSGRPDTIHEMFEGIITRVPVTPQTSPLQ